MQKIVGVRRAKDRELYYFFQNIDDLKLGDKLVVNFDDFQTVVTVSKLGVTLEDDKATELKKIVRRATDSDIQKYEMLADKAKKSLPEIKKKSLELGLLMKFITAEYSLDNSKILIVFSSEERVDFRQLLKELAVMLKIRIELKQIGQRDEAKICDSVGICGQQCCCSRFLKEFEHVTVKMAKIQGLSLAPSKINGVCGRLMCCLGYESAFYEEMVKKMPKINSEIDTPSGRAIVVYNDILREKVSVKRKTDSDSFVVEEFTLQELKEGKRIITENEKVEEDKSVSEKIDEIMQKSAELLNENVEKPKAESVKENIQKVQEIENLEKNNTNNAQKSNNTKKNNFNKNRQNRDNKFNKNNNHHSENAGENKPNKNNTQNDNKKSYHNSKNFDNNNKKK